MSAEAEPATPGQAAQVPTSGHLQLIGPAHAHRWVAEAFFALTEEQAKPVVMGTEPPTVGEWIADAVKVGCRACGEWWSPLVASQPCSRGARAVVAVPRNARCECGSGRKAKKCCGADAPGGGV